MCTPMYVCVYVPEFPAQARLRHRPEKREQAVVVLDGDVPFQAVCSATRRAIRDGIVHGMARTELDSFADVTVMDRCPAEEQSARHALLEMAGNITPRAQVVEQGDSVYILVLDVAGTESLFGPVHRLAARVQQAVMALGLHSRIAVSQNFHAAVCAAPYAPRSGTIIPAGKEREALARLPIACLRPTPEQAETLAMWGLHTCCELAALPDIDLVARFGQAGKRLRLLSRGELQHLFVPEEETFALEERVVFEASVDVLDSLLFVIGPMLGQLIHRAGARALALASVTIRLQLEGAAAHDSVDESRPPSEHTRTVKPALPLLDRDVLLKLLHLDLQAHPPSAAVAAITVRAEPGDRSKAQLGLFVPQLPEPTRLDITLARIAALVGEDRVGRARLLDTHRSDSFVMERYRSPSGLSVNDTSVSGSTLGLRRLRPPVALTMQVHAGAPAAFHYESHSYEVREACGPWRRSGDWWSADVWSRDEWDVRATTRDGETVLCVLAYDLLLKQWQMDAFYD